MKTNSSIIELWNSILRAVGLGFFIKEDVLWKEWLELKNRDHNDLKHLLSSQAALQFKIRALGILLAEDNELIPSVWWKSSTGTCYPGDLIRSLGPELLSWAGEMTCHFADRKGKGSHSDAILALLAHFPENDPMAQRLFDRFALNDAEVGMGIDWCSGYNPFKELMLDRISSKTRLIIPEKWKRKADQQMRVIITNELSGKARPRTEYEFALPHYAEVIAHRFQDPSYSLEFLKDQVEFLLTLDLPDAQSSSSQIVEFATSSYFRFIGSENRELRKKLALLAVRMHKGYWGLSDDLAKEVISEFPEETALVDKLTTYLDERRQMQLRRKELEQQMMQKEESLLGRMTSFA